MTQSLSPITSFHLDALRQKLKPFRLHFFPRLRSTNDHAAAMRRQGRLFAPAIILTPRQMAGRGRGSNKWFSNSGVLTVTFVLPLQDDLAPHQLPLIAGLAVRDACAELTGHADISLKWPNDILHDNRKLAGLLCERLHKADLIGLGLNVNLQPRQAPANLRHTLTSLGAITGSQFDMNDVLVQVTTRLKSMLQRHRSHPPAELLRAYNRHHAIVGSDVRIVTSPGEPALWGRCEGIDADGRLLLRQGQTLQRIIAGHVILNPSHVR